MARSRSLTESTQPTSLCRATTCRQLGHCPATAMAARSSLIRCLPTLGKILPLAPAASVPALISLPTAQWLSVPIPMAPIFGTGRSGCSSLRQQACPLHLWQPASGQGVYEIQIAPSDTQILYMMFDGYVFRSTNQGSDLDSNEFHSGHQHPRTTTTAHTAKKWRSTRIIQISSMLVRRRMAFLSQRMEAPPGRR